MKIITIKQPWAWAIFHAGKDVENRKWLPAYRGLLGIHAAKSTDPKDYKVAADFIRSLGHAPPTFEELRGRGETGAILGTVEFVGTKTDSDWYLGDLWYKPIELAYQNGDSRLYRDIRCYRLNDVATVHEYRDCQGWHFANPVTLPTPIVATGRLGLWDFDLKGMEVAA